MDIAVFLLAFSIRTFVAEPFSIPSTSMHPTLEVGNQIIVSKSGYGNYDFFGVDIANTRRHRSIKRGDVMVFIHPREPQLEYIKRVAGLPGENIRYENKRLFINDQEIKRVEKQNNQAKTINNDTSRYLELINETNNNRRYEITLNDSSRSRADINITLPEGHYFMLGDNRDNSNDSRFWGAVPEENFVGKLIYILP